VIDIADARAVVLFAWLASTSKIERCEVCDHYLIFKYHGSNYLAPISSAQVTSQTTLGRWKPHFDVLNGGKISYFMSTCIHNDSPATARAHIEAVCGLMLQLHDCDRQHFIPVTWLCWPHH
jgi:hypothetical protein